MRRGSIAALAIVAFLLPTMPALAQTRERIKITNVRMGLPNGPFVTDSGRRGMYKAGHWAPIYADLECVRDTEENITLIVETTDSDGAATEAQIETGAMVKGERRTAAEIGKVALLKPGSSYSEVVIRPKGSSSGRTFGADARVFGGTSGIEGPSFVVLSVGCNPNFMRFPTADRKADDDPNARNAQRNSWIEVAQLTELGLLPDQWFGYNAVDVMYLGTGANRTFWEDFNSAPNASRRQAIVEWVRRGGRLVVSVGINADAIEAIRELKEMLPATLDPGKKKSSLAIPYTWTSPAVRDYRTGTITARNAKSEFAVIPLTLRPERSARMIMAEGNAQSRIPLMVQGSYGLGRVTVVGFDLDRPPAADWPDRAWMWENITNQCGFLLPAIGVNLDKYGTAQRNEEYAQALQGSLDFFESVPVVSFGWVALFILIYIVLIGPVDYLFLKKVVKRLEWTWVTFPLIVVSVSAAAYFAAYALKGRDLKTNKVDIVDIDLSTRRVDGQSWFTLFSPRIHDYTIAVEPAGAVAGGDPNAPRWTAGDARDSARFSLVSWQAPVERNRYSSGGSLFQKRYRYQTGADPVDPNRELYGTALERVSIQVWTTKAFSARWSSTFDPANPPIVADLSTSRASENVLVGTIKNNLPVQEFTDAAILWRGKAFILPLQLPAGVEKRVTLSVEPGEGTSATVQELNAWVNDYQARYRGDPKFTPTTRNQFGAPSTPSGTTTRPNFRLWEVMFHEAADENARRTGSSPASSLRYLDQSWRVTSERAEEAILVLRTPTREGAAEQMTTSADSPSRLWIDDLPTRNGSTRPIVPGTLKQETYVRVFIPVKSNRK